jgi:hypothetical protein
LQQAENRPLVVVVRLTPVRRASVEMVIATTSGSTHVL